MHHNNLYSELDPDTALHGGYPRGKAYLVKKLLKDLSGLTAWKTYAYFLAARPRSIPRPTSPSARSMTRRRS
jgi:hypothetical protein